MIDTEIQIACAAADVPDDGQLQAWVAAALDGRREAAELTVRIVDETEARRLNATYRGRDYATNVLSFPAELPAGVDLPVLGDLVICAGVVAAEAAEQGKTLPAHWAHMVVHGVLHLLGYDHMEDDEAAVMEAAERTVLAGLGIADPYAEGADAPPEPAAGPAR